MTHKLVPIEPTEEMIASGNVRLCCPVENRDSAWVYEAMIASAPPAKGLAEMLEGVNDRSWLLQYLGVSKEYGFRFTNGGWYYGPTPEEALRNALREVGDGK